MGIAGLQTFQQTIYSQLPQQTNPTIPTQTPTSLGSQTPATPTLLGPGEIIRNSGKFAKPTRIPGKNYCKDEVVIRNADSGKGLWHFLFPVSLLGLNPPEEEHPKYLTLYSQRGN